ncbi:unnamed protein product [Prorocentrum cordatum]|uniref:Pentatricopeptide repeat-containing protein, chloroplastic n=1 Tax=Prorocentrum cordatum TaxID=2364126 RepID=A0ABN9VFC5_9DINO|nr:unnamed protein product [Polarella glacialis]
MCDANVEQDVISYSAAISASEKGEQWQWALALLRIMLEAMLEPQSATTLGSALAGHATSGSGLCRCSARCGRRSWSLTSSLSYNAGISACEKRGEWPQALSLLNELWEVRLQPDAISYSAGISACGKGEQWKHALSLIDEMREAKMASNLIAAVLVSARAKREGSGSKLCRCSARCGRRCCSRTSDQLQCWGQRVRERRAVAAGIGVAQRDASDEVRSRCHQLQRCDQRVWEMRAVAAFSVAAQQHVAGDGGAQLVSYSAGISACEKGGQWQRALVLLGEMWEVELERSAIGYNAGISACGKGEQWQHALALLCTMRQVRVEPTDSATALVSARVRKASSGNRHWRCSARCGR